MGLHIHIKKSNTLTHTSRPSTGIIASLLATTPPPMSGLSWFGVDVTPSEPSALTPSHAHPEPKRPAAAALNLAFISSSEPKAASIAALRSAEGPLVSDGAPMTVQKNEWFLSIDLICYIFYIERFDFVALLG